MIQKLEFKNEKVIGWRLEGKINQEAYKPMMDTLEKKLDTTDNLNLYMEIPETPGMSPQVIWDGIKSGISNLRKYNDKLKKVAVVTEKGWLQTMAKVENHLFPGINEKAFSFQEVEVAREWVNKR